MTTNERIALALGWVHGCNPERCGGCVEGIPDYEHSLDALLEPLGVLRERGWTWLVECMDGDVYRAALTEWEPPMNVMGGTGHGIKRDIYTDAATPSEALALAVAEALEASNG